MNKTIVAWLAFVAFSACNSPETKTDDTSTGPVISADVKTRIDSTLKSFIDSGKTAAVSALIFEKGKEVYFNAYGYADREANKPIDRNTIVRIFSMTKPVTGVALMTLYEKGLFQLDDSLAKYCPEFANMKVKVGVDAKGNPILVPAKRPITIRDITRHTAGLPGYGSAPNLLDNSQPLSAMAKKLGSMPLDYHPGDQWSYGLSVDVQAYLVEKLSGKPYDQYLQETIFTPLQMTNTGYFIPEANRSKFAAAYNRDNATGVLTRVPDSTGNELNFKQHALKPGGHGLASTLDDYMKFAQMLVNKGKLGNVQILKPETVELMSTNQLSDTISQRQWLPGKGRVGFGIDFAVRVSPPQTSEENNGIVGEFFWDGAASTLFWVDPKNELTAVLFTQLFPFDQVQLHKRFRDAVYGAYKPATAAK